MRPCLPVGCCGIAAAAAAGRAGKNDIRQVGAQAPSGSESLFTGSVLAGVYWLIFSARNSEWVAINWGFQSGAFAVAALGVTGSINVYAEPTALPGGSSYVSSISDSDSERALMQELTG